MGFLTTIKSKMGHKPAQKDAYFVEVTLNENILNTFETSNVNVFNLLNAFAQYHEYFIGYDIDGKKITVDFTVKSNKGVKK